MWTFIILRVYVYPFGFEGGLWDLIVLILIIAFLCTLYICKKVR